MTVLGTTTTSDGVDIEWDRLGSGSPLVLVHGFTDYRSLMLPLATPLSEHYDVLNLDLRGHGGSGRNENFGLGRMAADVAEVCADLGLDAPLLVGHSLGALVVTAAAADVDAQGVVNIDQSLDLNHTAARINPVAAQLRDPATFHTTLDELFSGENTPGLDTELQAKLDQCAWDVDQDVVLGIWADLLDGPNDENSRRIEAILATVTVPYLVYLGSDPGGDYISWLERHVPTATIETFPGEAHFLHLANPDRLLARVQALIA